MAHAREIYSSSNGDRWLLTYDPDANRVSVRHEPNPASGGRPSITDIAVFLSRNLHAAERQALLRLIGGLAEEH
jgi:hypothetical protein